ncbi:MAG: hypothetical protein H7A18_00345 [Sinobacteraceae bacterium]|nr:hypothetical protein [Nevskiaceae bacterium]MCP5338607.1 hypothetical protein [Nevskiaceae bacterium]MCP5466714.1 hypothetical protein [Nevskiaceae bacterium]MCP5470515.1 hypothetical protein [Nevskiaceae bacterium]
MAEDAAGHRLHAVLACAGSFVDTAEAERIAGAVNGVKSVENRLDVK